MITDTENDVLAYYIIRGSTREDRIWAPCLKIFRNGYRSPSWGSDFPIYLVVTFVGPVPSVLRRRTPESDGPPSLDPTLAFCDVLHEAANLARYGPRTLHQFLESC